MPTVVGKCLEEERRRDKADMHTADDTIFQPSAQSL